MASSEGKSSSLKVALVTGAGSGIGRASAKALYQAGYCVVLAGRRMGPLQETMNEMETSRYLIVVTDVSKADQVEHLFTETKNRFGRLDVLFNNAGIGSAPIPLDEIDPTVFQQVMDTNVTGSFLCSQQAWKIMKVNDDVGGGGRIINNGSISAHTPRPMSVPYTTAKHAITGLTKSLNLDGRSIGICVSQIDIGNAATAMTERLSTTGALQPYGDNNDDDNTTTLVTEATMSVDIVADTIVYLANLPLEANVPFMTIMATKMPYAGRG